MSSKTSKGVLKNTCSASAIETPCFSLRPQPVDATHWLNRSAGVSKFNVSLGLSLRRLATALRYLVYIQFMNFPIITGIQAFGHTQNDPFTAIGEHDHLAGSLIEGDAFNFPDLAQLV